MRLPLSANALSSLTALVTLSRALERRHAQAFFAFPLMGRASRGRSETPARLEHAALGDGLRSLARGRTTGFGQQERLAAGLGQLRTRRM